MKDTALINCTTVQHAGRLSGLWTDEFLPVSAGASGRGAKLRNSHQNHLIFGQASSPLTARLYRANPIHAEALQERIQYELLDEISGWHTQTMREAAVGA